MKRNNHLVAGPGFILLLLLSSLSAAQEPENVNQLSFEEQFLKNPTPENFNKLNSADQLRFLKNENNYRADLAIEFYKNENNVGLDSNVDVKYFGDKNNVGKNPAADEKFYSSNYAGATTETLRDFLRTGLEQKEAAAKYFSDKFPAEFEFKEIAEGFRYDAATGLLKNGEDSVNVNNLNYKKIIAVKDGTKFGFDFVDEKGREIRIVGEAGREERIIDLQDDKIIFTNSQQIFVQEFTILKNEPTSFSYNKDGTLEVKGPVKGIVWTDSNNYVDFTNRVGTLVIKPNGDFKAENAEILTRKIYVDGKAEKVGNLITAQDHVDRKLKDTDENEQSIKKRQNIDPEGRTVVVDRTSRVGVKTQGQTGENNVKIHLDELPPSDSDASDKIPSLEEAKKIARDIRPREGDLVNNAEVWIQKDERGTSVIAKGKVDVGFYDVGLNGGISSDIRKKEPHFTGHNGKSELELKLGTRTEISLRGKVDYSDDKYSTAEGEKFGIQTVEDGASLKITRNEDSKEDFIYANCFDCESGINAIRIQKTIVSGDPHVIPGVIKNREANSITFVLRVDENGKLGYYPAQDRGLGILAQAQTEGKNVGIGRGLDLQFPCGDKDCYVQIKEERGLGTTQVFYEEFNGKTTRTIPIDTGYGTVLGEAKVIISAKDEENLNKLLTLAKTKQLQAAARLEFSDDPALRKLISQKLGIDVSKLNDKAYLKTFEDSARYHLLVQEGYDRLSKLDINPEDKEKLDAVLASRGIKPELAVAFDIYTKILENKKRRELADLEAAAKSCQGNPTACSFTPAQLKAKQEKAQKDLISAVNKREAAYREFKQREWEYLKNHPPEDAKNAQAQAVQLGKDIKGNQEDALRIESSLRGTKETPGAEARAAAAKQRYDQLSKEYGPRIEFDRTSQEYAIGFTEESVKRAIGAEINTLEAELKAARDEYYRERELVNILSKNLVNAKNRESDARGELEYLSSDFADRDDVVANLLHAAGLHQEAKDFVEDNPYLSGTSKQELKQSYEGYTEAQDLERSEFLAALGDDLSIIQAVTIKNNVLQRNPELQETPQFQKANDAITQAIKARGEEQDRDRDEQIARQKKQMTERRAGIFTGPSDWKRPPDILGSAVDFFIPPIAVLRAAGVIPEDIDTIDYVGHVGGRLLEKGHEPTLDYLAPAIASTGGVRLTLDALVAVGVLREDGVESLRDFGAYSREKAEQEDKALDSLLDQREHAQKPRQVLQAYADEGLSASEAFEAMETGNYDPRVLHKHRELEGTPVVFKREGLRIEDGNTVVLRELANGRLPEETAAGREGLAAQALQRAENEEAIHGGKAAFVENEFREVSAYSGTVAAAEANVKLEALEETTLGISEKYHQTIVEPVGEGFLSIDNIVTAPFDVAEVVRAGAIALKVYRAEKQLLTVGKLIVHGTEEAKAALRLARTELRAAQASGDVARVEQATERARAVYQNAVQAAEQEAKIVGRTADLGHQVKVPPYRRALAAEHNQEARRLADATEDLQEAERVHDVARIEKAQDAVRQSEQKLTQLEDLDQAAKIADARPAAKRVLGELPVSEKVRDAERNFEEAQAVYNREVDALGEARKTPETSEKVRIANEELAKVRAEDLDNVPPEIADARAQNDLAVEGFADSEHTAAVRQKAAAESNVVQLRKEERPGGAKCNILRAAAIYGLSVDCVDDLDEIDTPTIVPARESGPRVISGQREIPFVSTGDRTHDLYIEAYQEASVSGGVSPEMVKKLKLTDGWTGEGAENVALKIYDEKFLAKINEKRKLAGKPAIKPTFKDPVILKIRKKGAGSYGNTPDWLQKIHGDLCAAKAATCLEEIDLDTGLWQISEEAKGPDLRELIENALDEADQAKLKAIDDRFTMATAEAKKRADEAIPALQKRVSDEKLPGYVYNDELNNIKKNLNDEIKNAAKIASDERQTLLQPYSQTFDAVNYEGRTINVREKTEQLFDKLRKADTEVLDAHWRNLKCIDTDCTRLVVVDLGAATQGDYSTITEEAAKAYARDALLGGNQDISSGIGRLLEQNQYTPGRVSLDEAVGTPHPTICGGAIYPGILVGTAIDTGCGLPGIVEEGIDVPEGYVSLPIEREITDFSGSARVNVQDLSKATPSSAPQKQALEIPSVQRKVVQNVIEAAEKQGENAIITRYQRLSQRIEQGESIVIPKHYHTTSKEGLEGILDSGKIEARRSIAHGAFTSTQPEGAYGDFTFVLGSDIEKLPADVTVFPQRTWYANQEDILVDEKNIAYIIAKDSRADEAREFIHQRNLNIEVVPLSQAQRERRLIIDARMNSPDRANVLLEGSVRINFPQRRRFSDIFPEEASLEQRAAKIFDTLEDGEVIIIQERNYAYISIEGDKKYLSYVDPESRQLNRQPLLATEREADDIFPSNDELFQFQRSVEDLMGANVYRAGVKIDPKVEGQFLEALANGEFSNIRNPRIAPHPTICGGAIYPGILVGTAIDTGCGLPSFADDLEGITEGEFVEEALPPGVPTTIEGIPTPTTSSPEVISPRKLSVEVDLDITIESGKFRLEGKKYTYDPVDGWKGGFFGRKPDAETTARLETARMQNVVNSKPVLKEGQQILIVKRDNSLVAGTFDGIDLDIELKPSPTFGEAKLENGVEVSSGSVNRFSKSSTKDPTLEPRLIIEGDFVRVRTVDGTSTVGRFDGIKGTDFLLTDKTGTKKIPLAELDPSSILKEGDEVVIGVTRPAGYRESAVTEIRGRYFENENSLTLLTDEGVAVLPKENVNVDSLRRAVPEERRVVSPVPETEIEPIDLPSCPIGGALTGKAAAGPCFSARVPRTIADLEKNKIPIQRTPLPQTEETIATVNVQDLSKATPSLGLQTQALEIPSVQQQVIRNVIEEAEQQGQNVIASRYKDLLQKAEQGEKVVVPKHYHGTSKEGLEGILDGGKIEARFEQVYPGAFTSTRPEIGEGTSNFGDFSIALGSDTERLPHVLNPQGDGHAWVSFQDDIPVSENNIAYIIAEDSRVEEARQILEQRNLNIKVIPASEAKKERTLITDARINSPDRANVLFETGLEINSPQKADFFSYFDRKIGLEGSSTNIFDTLEDGEVINIDSQYYYLSIEGDKKFLNTIDLNNRQLTKRQLVATKAEADEIYRPLISKETGKRPRSVQDLVELGVSGDRPKPYRTGVKVNPRSGENFLGSLSDGRTLPLGTEFPPPAIPLGEGVLGVVGKRYSRTPDGINWEQQKRWWEFWRKEETVVDPILIEELNRAEAAS